MSARPQIRIPAQYQPLAFGAVAIVIAMVVLGSLQLATRPTALKITPEPTGMPTEAPGKALIVPTSTPVLAPTATATPIAPQIGSQAAPVARSQMGKGLTLDSAPAAPAEAPEQPAAAPPANQQYLANVAAQAPHSPRGNPALAPAGGDYVAQPTVPPAYAQTIERQAPHKVR